MLDFETTDKTYVVNKFPEITVNFPPEISELTTLVAISSKMLRLKKITKMYIILLIG